MSKSAHESLWTVIYLVAGVVAAWLTWFFLPGRKFSHSAPNLLPFIIAGSAGALIYASIKLRGLGSAVIMIFLMFLLQLALIPPLRTEAAIRAGLWAVPVGLSFLISAYLFKICQGLPIGKFILMALFLGFAYAFVAALFRLRAGLSVYKGLLLWQFTVGAMLGGFLGILIELFELIPARKKSSPAGFDLPV
jgi:hypothetical protein